MYCEAKLNTWKRNDQKQHVSEQRFPNTINNDGKMVKVICMIENLKSRTDIKRLEQGSKQKKIII